MKYNRTVKLQFFNSMVIHAANPLELPLVDDDLVIVHIESGEEIARAVINPEKYFEELDNSLPKILRKATADDIIQHKYNLRKEKEAMIFCERKVAKLGLDMKLVNTFYQFDRKKLMFFFTAENRIDFRELVKILASEFKTRIEMRQINPREEVRLMDSIGSCGRPLCCANHLDAFSPVTTLIVKEQNLPMNPSKISGSCGKLKCCFLYEYDEYRKVLEKFPVYGSIVSYEKEKYFLDKIDIFKDMVTLKKMNDDEFAEMDFNEYMSKVVLISEPEKKDETDDEFKE
ncbi:MAG: stage 0 sporulation protein [Candidatus Marinimicrobia bacterium]|nr:stage 0 sporulation protein [Candidatus Neomarinimicrobiota bacterium]